MSGAMSSATSSAASSVLPASRRSDWVVAALAFAALLAWDFSGLDLPSARLFGNAQGFAWRDHWLTSNVLHSGGRWLALVVLGAIAVNALRPLPWLATRLSRRQRWWWLLATLACALLVPAIKQLSLSSCPWELAEFGGAARYVSHWRLGLPDGGPGHCFPSGHAVSGFALFSGWFVLRDTWPRAARLWLAAVVTAGLLFGAAQLVRGAHYPSHTLWTAWFCWTLCALAARWLPQRAAPRHAAA
jgi:membrane-associated PAP2 superfamily phosphatase